MKTCLSSRLLQNEKNQLIDIGKSIEYNRIKHAPIHAINIIIQISANSTFMHRHGILYSCFQELSCHLLCFVRFIHVFYWNTIAEKNEIKLASYGFNMHKFEYRISIIAKYRYLLIYRNSLLLSIPFGPPLRLHSRWNISWEIS